MPQIFQNFMQNLASKSITSFAFPRLWLLTVMAALSPQWGNAHEYWLEPEAYVLKAGEPVRADIKNGVDFKGITFPYIRHEIVSLEIVNRAGRAPLSGRDGDFPAINAPTKAEGLQVVSFHNQPSRITFREWEKFVNYVNEEGAAWVAQRHRDRGLDTETVKEVYSRCAKTLVQVGPADASDRDFNTGMPAELVAKQNPYALKAGESLDLVLFWQSEPRPNNQLRVFEKTRDPAGGESKLRQFDLTTDAKGMASFVPVPGAEYLLSSVILFERGTKTSIDQGEPAWESYWASLTFRAAD